MRMFKPLFWLMVMFVGAAFAADGVNASRVIPSNTGVVDTDSVTSQSKARTTSGRTVATDTGRTIARPIASENTAGTVSSLEEVGSRNTITARGVVDAKAQKQTDINSNSAIRRAGLVLRPSVAEYGGRAIIAGTEQQTGSNIKSEIRKVTGRAASKETISEAKDRLEQTAELNKSCQDQYNECMDQFCSVVDANQKRCSCSSNLSKYSKVEDAVNKANTKLNEVAQNIRYIGLSADEIRAIMTATEAEEALSGTRDTTENRNMLEQIEKMIKDPTASTSSYYSSSDFGLDMNLDFSSSTDIFSLDFLTNNTGTFSNLRGTELYNAARSRCSAVLTQCRKAGATVSQITGNYDLAIDKDCVAYENGLKKLNETLVSNVRSAERMLQKARLAVVQNKNQYDAKGCIGALEACMTDDMVCGDDYVKCVDPTKKYIDENGDVVLGQNIKKILDFVKDYNNSGVDSSFLLGAYENTSMSNCSGDGKCIVKYLLQKIGMGQKVTDGGLCRAVLDKCQLYTYSGDTYNEYNEIVVNYIQRAMVNIKAAQYKIISDYASTCMVDVAACYNQQVTQINAWTSVATTDSIFKVMKGACRNVALTCARGIFAYDETSCPTNGGDNNQTDNDNTCIESLSTMFYQTLLCRENSTYTKDTGTPGSGNYVNSQCKCDAGYEPVEGSCLKTCSSNASRNVSNQCECNSGWTGDGYTCTQT